MNVIEVFQAAIRDSGLTLSELARRTGVHESQLSRFVRGERMLALPSAEKLFVYFKMKMIDKDGNEVTGK